jgi:rhamnulokinase
MAAEAKYLAFDLGAESGRGVVGFFDGERLRLGDAHRFASTPVRLVDTLHWDILRLFSELKKGLAMAVAAHGGEFDALGVDTWGVDFGLLGRGDVLLGNPRHYRDHANDGMVETAFGIVPADRIFDRTGIQFMQLNSLIQLLAMQRQNSPLLEMAQTLLFIPDLLNFWFTGVKTTEFSIASTSQMIDPRTRQWAKDLIADFHLPAHLLTDLVPTGTPIGTLRADIAAECGCGPLNVIAPGEHDTASAVVAVPASTSDYAYISSGTWSLMGIETTTPRISAATQAANFTNEGGACNTIRFLKNIMGLWLVQECRRSWARKGQDHSYPDLTRMAEQAPGFVSLIDPDDPAFLAPTDMVTAIRDFCLRTGQTAPADTGATVRCCLESLALKYRWTLGKFEEFKGRRIETVHIVGGGTQNHLLCQLAANAMNRPVIAGPVEATAIGNVLMQALGRGRIGSLEQAREVVRRSFTLDTYLPQETAAWDAAYERFLRLCL